jgi:hypothetical protein
MTRGSHRSGRADFRHRLFVHGFATCGETSAAGAAVDPDRRFGRPVAAEAGTAPAHARIAATASHHVPSDGAATSWTWAGSSATLPSYRRRRRISQVPGEPHVCNPLRSLTPAGPSRSGQTTRVGAASALAYGGRSQRLCFRGSITQQLHSLCTLRSAGHPATTQHSVPGGGHLSRAAVETLQGSFERFQFFIRSPLPGLPGAHAGHLARKLRSFASLARFRSSPSPSPSRRLEPEPDLRLVDDVLRRNCADPARAGARARARRKTRSLPMGCDYPTGIGLNATRTAVRRRRASRSFRAPRRRRATGGCA